MFSLHLLQSSVSFRFRIMHEVYVGHGLAICLYPFGHVHSCLVERSDVNNWINFYLRIENVTRMIRICDRLNRNVPYEPMHIALLDENFNISLSIANSFLGNCQWNLDVRKPTLYSCIMILIAHLFFPINSLDWRSISSLHSFFMGMSAGHSVGWLW